MTIAGVDIPDIPDPWLPRGAAGLSARSTRSPRGDGLVPLLSTAGLGAHVDIEQALIKDDGLLPWFLQGWRDAAGVSKRCARGQAGNKQPTRGLVGHIVRH